jgi:hypothetical protein
VGCTLTAAVLGCLGTLNDSSAYLRGREDLFCSMCLFPLPEDGPMNDRNVPQKTRTNECIYCLGVVCVDRSAMIKWHNAMMLLPT